MIPITWVFDTSRLRCDVHLNKSQALLYDALIHLRTPAFPFLLSLLFRLRLYIIFCSYLLLSLAMHSSFYLMVVFLFILRLPEQIASSCSSTCNTCNTAGCTCHDASRVDALLEDVVSSSQAPPSSIPIRSVVGSSHSALGPLDGLCP